MADSLAIDMFDRSPIKRKPSWWIKVYHGGSCGGSPWQTEHVSCSLATAVHQVRFLVERLALDCAYDGTVQASGCVLEDAPGCMPYYSCGARPVRPGVVSVRGVYSATGD